MDNLTKLVVEPKDRWVTGKERNKIRSELRKAYKAGKLMYRTTYYESYDSCHGPEVTPDAQWKFVAIDDTYFLDKLKAQGPSVVIAKDGTIELHSGYSVIQVKVVS